MKQPPPSVPARNGSRLEHADSPVRQQIQTKYFDTNIGPELTPPPPPGKKGDHLVKGVGGGQAEAEDGDEKNGLNNSYRDSWKKRQDQQNSMIFNFLGDKKDVSHIENDGLDLSKRNKKGGKVGGNIYLFYDHGFAS